jgi:nicotinamidase-related amidase
VAPHSELIRIASGSIIDVVSRRLKPREGDALLVVDVLNDFEHDDGGKLLASFRDRAAAMQASILAGRAAGIPIIYVNDDMERWDSDAPRLAQDAARGKGGAVVSLLLPEPGDRVLLKHRYSAFDHTALGILLESLHVERLILIGSATEGCIVQTAIDAREQGLKASIVADACATIDSDLEAVALEYAERVGGVHVERQSARPSGDAAKKERDQPQQRRDDGDDEEPLDHNHGEDNPNHDERRQQDEENDHGL